MNIDKDIDSMMNIAEQFFGTEQDPEQIPITKESLKKLLKLDKNAFSYKKDGRGNIIGWIVLVPTNRKLAEDFINGEISEKELFDKTKPQKKYDALYLCSVIVMPKYRRKGYAINMAVNSLNNMALKKDVLLFYWPFSKEGKLLAQKAEKILKRKIIERKNDKL